MAFKLQDIPLAADLLSVSQGDLKQNCDYFQATLGKDHQIVFGDFDTTTFEGRHTQVSLNSRGNVNLAMPGDGTDSLLWSSGGNVYWKNNTVAAGVQMTNSAVGSPSPIANKGYTFLPGGIMFCWGTQLATATNPVTFPNLGFTTPFVVTGCTNANDRAFAVTAISPTDFTYSVLNPAGVTIYWYAIGAK